MDTPNLPSTETHVMVPMALFHRLAACYWGGGDRAPGVLEKGASPHVGPVQGSVAPVAPSQMAYTLQSGVRGWTPGGKAKQQPPA